MVEAPTQEWYEGLSEAERSECAAALTDAYFAALNTDAWTEFQAAVRQWRDKAALKELVAV